MQNEVLQALDYAQRAAATSGADVLTIQAGPGTGKTRTILARAVLCAIAGERVRVLAFTRAAARELADRLGALGLAAEVRSRLLVGTIHALAAQVTAASWEGLGLERQPVVVDALETKTLEREARSLRRPAEELHRIVGGVSYAETLALGTRALRGPAGRRWRGGHVLVDEAQDLTLAEWRFVEALLPERITTVGDEAQALFEWRGALGSARPSCETETLALPHNYRSLGAVVDEANAIPVPEAIRCAAVRGPGGSVSVAVTERDEDLHDILRSALEGRQSLGRPGEAEIRSWALDGSPERGELAILSRTRRRLESVARVFADAGIPYHSPALEAEAWKRPESEPLRDVLRCVAAPHADVYLRRVLTRAGLRPGELLAAEVAMTDERPRSLWNWACDELPADREPARVLRVLAEARTRARGGDTPRGVSELLVLEGLAPCGLVETIPEDLEDLPAFFAWLADPRAGGERSRPRGSIELATIHAAKGREWRRVLLLGVEEGHLPTIYRPTPKRSQEAHEAEERRCFYVATTRAADALVYHRSRNAPEPWGRKTRPADASRFLSEIGR